MILERSLCEPDHQRTLMYWLLLFVPVTLVINHFDGGPIPLFIAATLAIIPLSKLMESSTTVLASVLGPTIGGLLSATMSNAPELIIGISALRNGLIDMLKSSICGAIIGTLLLGLGLSIFAGSRDGAKTFEGPMVSMNMGLLTITSLGLAIPAIFNISSASANIEISSHISVLMLILYAASVVYTLNHKNPPIDLVGVEQAMGGTSKKTARKKEPRYTEDKPNWSTSKALMILLGVTAVLAIVSDMLTASIQPAADLMHLRPVFAGMFLLSMVGNIPQFINSVSFAMKNQLTLALSVNLSSVTQLSLLVAPLLVLAGQHMHLPMNLIFSRYELVAILISVVVSRTLLSDCRTTWLEGIMLIKMYLMLAVGFYYQ